LIISAQSAQPAALEGRAPSRPNFFPLPSRNSFLTNLFFNKLVSATFASLPEASPQARKGGKGEGNMPPKTMNHLIWEHRLDSATAQFSSFPNSGWDRAGLPNFVSLSPQFGAVFDSMNRAAHLSSGAGARSVTARG